MSPSKPVKTGKKKLTKPLGNSKKTAVENPSGTSYAKKTKKAPVERPRKEPEKEANRGGKILETTRRAVLSAKRFLLDFSDRHRIGDRAKRAHEQARSQALVIKETTASRAKQFNDEYIEGTGLDKYIDKVDRTLGFLIPRKEYEYDNEAVKMASGPIRFGLWVFLAIFGVFLLWAGFAPLDSAALAPGTVVLDANRKVVDHLEGGIIARINVDDGDFVNAGDVLIRLSETAPKARLDITLGQYLAALAMESRLLAERDVMDAVVFHEELVKRIGEPDADKLMDAQRRIFETRKEALKGQESILQQRINQLQEEIEGLRAQETSVTEQLRLIKEEEDVVQKLVDQGQAVRPRLLGLQRKSAELTGTAGEFKARIAKANQAITENQLAILNQKTEFQEEVNNTLRETQGQVADLRERVTAAQDILTRIDIVAPQSGIITGLKYHTVGGVIPPGQEIMSIVPQDDDLVIEAKVNPQDIDTVRAGLEARVRLSAYSVRRVAMLMGEVERVSADRFVDQNSGMAYYLARVRINDDELLKLTEDGVELYPGMPADVMIVTGERTVLSYLIDPITKTFEHSMREQ